MIREAVAAIPHGASQEIRRVEVVFVLSIRLLLSF
jgi:hypothetical protein